MSYDDRLWGAKAGRSMQIPHELPRADHHHGADDAGSRAGKVTTKKKASGPAHHQHEQHDVDDPTIDHVGDHLAGAESWQ